MKKTMALLMALLIGTSALAACRRTQDFVRKEEKRQRTDGQMENDADSPAPDGSAGQMELQGSWQDEVSQRATMIVTGNDDGSYDILVMWSSSAAEYSAWEIRGTFDEEDGVLRYKDGKYSVHTVDGAGNETVSGRETTKGSFSRNGKKLRWIDSENSIEGLFVRISD